MIGAFVGLGGFGADHLDDVFVAVAHLDFVAEVAADEVGGEGDVGVEGCDFVVEEGDEVAVGGYLLFGEGVINSLVEELVGGVAGESADDVDGGDFEHDVHTALEVEAEVDFAALALTVGVAEVDLFVGHGVEVASLAGILERVLDGEGQGFVGGAGGNLLLYLLTVDVVFCFRFGSALNDVCHNCKRQLEQTNQSESPS